MTLQELRTKYDSLKQEFEKEKSKYQTLLSKLIINYNNSDTNFETNELANVTVIDLSTAPIEQLESIVEILERRYISSQVQDANSVRAAKLLNNNKYKPDYEYPQFNNE